MTFSDCCIALSLAWDGLGKAGIVAGLFGCLYMIVKIWRHPVLKEEKDEWYRAWTKERGDEGDGK